MTLCVTHNGDVFLALVIFKGKKSLEIIAQDVFIHTQHKARLDEDMMMEWTDLVWQPATEGNLLYLLKEINTTSLVIPGGSTSKIQPLDVCLNKPFKAFARNTLSGHRQSR